MAFEQDLKILTRTAGADLSSTGPYRFVEQSTSGAITVCNGAGENALGVLQNDPASGQAGAVAYSGLTKVLAGGKIEPGNLVTTTATGKAAVATNGQVILGEALTGGEDGEIITIKLDKMAYSGSVVITQDSGLQSTTVTLTADQVKALNTTPITLVAAPGAGYSIAFDSAVLFLDYGSAAYDGIAAGEDLNIRYTNGSGQLVATVEATGFLDATADALRYVRHVSDAAITPVANAALVAFMATGNIATGDSPLKIKTYYRVIPATL